MTSLLITWAMYSGKWTIRTGSQGVFLSNLPEVQHRLFQAHGTYSYFSQPAGRSCAPIFENRFNFPRFCEEFPATIVSSQHLIAYLPILPDMKIENATQVVTASHFYKRSHLCVCGGSGVGGGGGRGEYGGGREIKKLEGHRTIVFIFLWRFVWESLIWAVPI